MSGVSAGAGTDLLVCNVSKGVLLANSTCCLSALQLGHLPPASLSKFVCYGPDVRTLCSSFDPTIGLPNNAAHANRPTCAMMYIIWL